MYHYSHWGRIQRWDFDNGWAICIPLIWKLSLTIERTDGPLELALQWARPLPIADQWPLLDLARLTFGANTDQRGLLRDLEDH